jgi:ketosteroid isomerase-like protein
MNDDTREAIARAFLTEMQACVRGVDFVRAHALFAEDVVAFGTYAAVVSGRDRLERRTVDRRTLALLARTCAGSMNQRCADQ